MIFKDRYDAGRRLAQELTRFRSERPVVLALPRGGVPIGFEIARALDAPLDVFVARKVGAPQNPEFAIGAVAEDGVAIMDQQTAVRLGIGPTKLRQLIETTANEAQRQHRRYRTERPPIEIGGRTVIVVDDGLATGLTDLAALHALRARDASRIVLAVPVASAEALALAREEADEVVALEVPSNLDGVGRWYRDFTPVPDHEVFELLDRANSFTDGTHDPDAVEPAGKYRAVEIDLGEQRLHGDLRVPINPQGIVLFAHGSGSSRLSPRNVTVAKMLEQERLATLLFDLLTPSEADDLANVFDIGLLAERLIMVTRWVTRQSELSVLPLGYFGASTGAAAALQAAAQMGSGVKAVVSRGGRPDLAADYLSQVTAPTLLIVGSNDHQVLELNRKAAALLCCPHKIAVVRGATHLFTEPGALEAVAELAQRWFHEHLVDHAVDTVGPLQGSQW